MLIEAGQIFFIIIFLLNKFNYTGNKTEMKKYDIKGQKDTQKKRKMADIHCKGGKVLAFLSVRKLLWNWFNLIQFCCV